MTRNLNFMVRFVFHRYHRVLRKEREKGQKKALDELEKRDPEAYVEKLKKIEKDRVQVCTTVEPTF